MTLGLLATWSGKHHEAWMLLWDQSRVVRGIPSIYE
jgi:hypothetical protein